MYVRIMQRKALCKSELEIYVSRSSGRCIYVASDNPKQFNGSNSCVLAQMYLSLSNSGLGVPPFCGVDPAGCAFDVGGGIAPRSPPDDSATESPVDPVDPERDLHRRRWPPRHRLDRQMGATEPGRHGWRGTWPLCVADSYGLRHGAG